MGKKLYVGNLSFSVTDQVLADTFAQIGTVESARVITDRDSGRSKGFAFVEMSSNEEGQNAISNTDGTELEGQRLRVNEARPPENNRGGGDRGGFNRGGPRY